MGTNVDELVATNIEEIVAQWLNRKGIEYQFQTSLMGGFYELGGAVVDFLFPDRRLAWRVMGEYYHQGVQKRGSDLLQKELLSQQGWVVVDIWGNDILDINRRDQALNLALVGQEML